MRCRQGARPPRAKSSGARHLGAPTLPAYSPRSGSPCLNVGDDVESTTSSHDRSPTTFEFLNIATPNVGLHRSDRCVVAAQCEVSAARAAPPFDRGRFAA